MREEGQWSGMCMRRGDPKPCLNHGQPKNAGFQESTASSLVSGDGNIGDRSCRCFGCWLMLGSLCNWTKMCPSKLTTCLCHVPVSSSCVCGRHGVNCRHALSEQTCVVVLLVLGLVLFLLPEVRPVFADPVGDTPLLGSQGGAHHAVHGSPTAHIQAATQPPLVLLQQPITG